MGISPVDYLGMSDGRLPLRLACLDRLEDDAHPEEAFRLWFLEQGSAIVSIGDEVVSLVGPSCLCLNERESIRPRKTGECRVWSLRFLPSVINPSFSFAALRGTQEEFSANAVLDLFWLQAFLARSAAFRGLLVLGPVAARRFGEILQNMQNELNERPDGYWPCRSRSYLFELLHFLNGVCRNPFPWRGRLADTTDELVLSVMQYLDEKNNQKIAIADLTRRFNTNRTTLSRRFVSVTGMTVMEYLARTRMQLACLLLRDTTLPVAEIMYRVGIQDATHFGRLFRKEAGMTPSQYRASRTKFDDQPTNPDI